MKNAFVFIICLLLCAMNAWAEQAVSSSDGSAKFNKVESNKVESNKVESNKVESNKVEINQTDINLSQDNLSQNNLSQLNISQTGSADKMPPQPRIIIGTDNQTVPQDEETDPQEPKTSGLERFVQPLTRWAEDKIHDSSLVRQPNKKKASTKEHQLSLREAIAMAKRAYPGMVLGAKSIAGDLQKIYEIRIISDDGVIKTISINSLKTPSEVKP